MSGRQIVEEEVENQDMTACVVSWVMVCLYLQIAITYLALVETTFFYHCIFMFALTALFLALMCAIQSYLSPRYIYIINDKG